jgi:large subunit ribosomal protein L23
MYKKKNYNNMTTISETKKKWIEFLETNNTQTMIDLVKYPVITEKTYLSLYKNRQYTFDIDKRLTKTQIKKLFSNLFNVSVIAVNTHIPPRKQIRVGVAQGFRPTYKRAIITLKEGDSINYNLSNINAETK